jgi:hypothetical protein
MKDKRKYDPNVIIKNKDQYRQEKIKRLKQQLEKLQKAA